MQQQRPAVDILLIEDNPGDVRLVQEALRESTTHKTLHLARDGFEAMDFLRQQGAFSEAPRPALILLDLNLPGKHGAEVLDEIKCDDVLRKIPVVVLSGSNQYRDVRTCYDNHANCYVTKPADLDCFMETIQTIESFWLTKARLPPCH